ncbi:hypothetical protein ABFA07_005156 [Porites harrisoni]
MVCSKGSSYGVLLPGTYIWGDTPIYANEIIKFQIWPNAIVGAGSFWNYQSKVTPDSKEFAMMIDTQRKRMVQRGIPTCPSGCKCDVLTRCGQKYPQPY